jgi:DeoR/GlpR family transcriptional regulator of sugar metabolism
MIEEQPLVGIGDIAKFLKVSEATARRELKRKKAPIFYIGKFIAVMPSDLIQCLKAS